MDHTTNRDLPVPNAKNNSTTIGYPGGLFLLCAQGELGDCVAHIVANAQIMTLYPIE